MNESPSTFHVLCYLLTQQLALACACSVTSYSLVLRWGPSLQLPFILLFFGPKCKWYKKTMLDVDHRDFRPMFWRDYWCHDFAVNFKIFTNSAVIFAILPWFSVVPNHYSTHGGDTGVVTTLSTLGCRQQSSRAQLLSIILCTSSFILALPIQLNENFLPSSSSSSS